MVSVCLASDALLQQLPSYVGFSYLGRGVSLHGCSSKAQPLLLTLDEGYLLEILVHPISSLADKATWPQSPTCQSQSASLRTQWATAGESESPEDPVCHQAACYGGVLRGTLPHRKVLPDEQAGWGEQGWVALAEPSQVPSVHPHSQHAAQWCEERKWETWKGYWKLPFSPQLCSYRHYDLYQITALCTLS